MSWSFSFEGTKDEVGKQFDNEKQKCAAAGMIEAEQDDIDEARNFVMQIAEMYGRVGGAASGHWINPGNVATEPVPTFGRIFLDINARPAADGT